MNTNMKSGLMLAAIIVGALVGFALSEALLPSRNIELKGELGFYIVLKCILTTMNMASSLMLMSVYIRVYSDTNAKFSIGLVFVAFALFIYATTSNPIITAYCGFCVQGLGPFTMIPDLFSALALIMLLYLGEK